MKKLVFLVTALIAVTFSGCSSDDDNGGGKSEKLYDVQYTDIIFTFEKGHNIAYYEYMHPQDSMTIYEFTDYRAKDTTYVSNSFKRVYYPKTKKTNYYSFSYSFSNSSVNIQFDNGTRETIRLQKNTPNRPIYSDKVYFNGKAYSPGAAI